MSAPADGKSGAPAPVASATPVVLMTIKTVESQLQELSNLCKQSVDKCTADYKSQASWTSRHSTNIDNKLRPLLQQVAATPNTLLVLP
jgi:hypothetical protein